MKSQIQPERSTHSPTEVKETFNKMLREKAIFLPPKTIILVSIWGPAISIVQWILRTDDDIKITIHRKTNTKVKILGPVT